MTGEVWAALSGVSALVFIRTGRLLFFCPVVGNRAIHAISGTNSAVLSSHGPENPVRSSSYLTGGAGKSNVSLQAHEAITRRNFLLGFIERKTRVLPPSFYGSSPVRGNAQVPD